MASLLGREKIDGRNGERNASPSLCVQAVAEKENARSHHQQDGDNLDEGIEDADFALAENLHIGVNQEAVGHEGRRNPGEALVCEVLFDKENGRAGCGRADNNPCDGGGITVGAL